MPYKYKHSRYIGVASSSLVTSTIEPPVFKDGGFLVVYQVFQIMTYPRLIENMSISGGISLYPIISPTPFLGALVKKVTYFMIYVGMVEASIIYSNPPPRVRVVI